jgi:hypothetical protein
MFVNIGPYVTGKKGGGWKRKKEIRIDDYDVWNMDHILALIIEPMLIELKKQKRGYPGEMLNLIGAPEDAWEFTDEQYALASAKWDEILDKMIWAFHEMNDGDYTSRLKKEHGEGWLNHVKAHEARMQEGFSLFGQYFRSLWD